ncbi:hypothetical protein HK405_011891 [Cladochytrium tenue]|nr:hypothetical protein HK405_011891 [Cladochytrium tenue]
MSSDCSILAAAFPAISFGSNCCTWKVSGTNSQVVCSSAGAITALSIDQIKLTSIPSGLASLTSMQELLLNGNQLEGTVPDTLWTFTQLNNLDIANNSFTGAVPDGLKKLTKLQILSLYENGFSGSIPELCDDLTELNTLYLGLNQFTGTVPSSIGNCAKMVNLFIDYTCIDDNYLPGNVKNLLASGGINYGNAPAACSTVTPTSTSTASSTSVATATSTGTSSGATGSTAITASASGGSAATGTSITPVTSATSASDSSSSSSSSTPAGAIAGGVVGGIFIIVVGIVLVVWLQKRRGNQPDKANLNLESYSAGPGVLPGGGGGRQFYALNTASSEPPAAPSAGTYYGTPSSGDSGQFGAAVTQVPTTTAPVAPTRVAVPPPAVPPLIAVPNSPAAKAVGTDPTGKGASGVGPVFIKFGNGVSRQPPPKASTAGWVDGAGAVGGVGTVSGALFSGVEDGHAAGVAVGTSGQSVVDEASRLARAPTLPRYDELDGEHRPAWDAAGKR